MSFLQDWKIKYGDQEIPITANDVVETLGRQIGYAYYKLENDEKTKGHVQMKIVLEMDIQILELVKAQFSGAVEEARRRHLHMKMPGKKRVGHKVQGKPGDILDLTPEKLPGKEKL